MSAATRIKQRCLELKNGCCWCSGADALLAALKESGLLLGQSVHRRVSNGVKPDSLNGPR